MLGTQEIANQLNAWGKQGKPFVFLVDFLAQKPLVFPLDGHQDQICWEIPYSKSCNSTFKTKDMGFWEIDPVPFGQYKTGFDRAMRAIHNGNSYLLNLTQPTRVKTNLVLEDIFALARAKYKIFLRNEFVCFSPETFVQIENGRIFSFPMKGTIDAGKENAEALIMSDKKEIAEHNTIVDLIRNDLSLVAENVAVDKFRFMSQINTNRNKLLQVSSQISGDLPRNYNEIVGDIIFTLLPAGSISGAPKQKTIEIIAEAENYDRGYYTGVFGVFDGKNLDSCVLIRYIENQNGQLVYKSGGGITFLSRAENEYDELLKKVYVPIA